MLTDTCLSARKGEDKSFHGCGRHLKLMQSYLSVVTLRYSSFNDCGGPANSLKGGFNPRNDRESSFYTCGSPVKLVHVCLGA